MVKKKAVKRVVRKLRQPTTTLGLLTVALATMYKSDYASPGVVISYIEDKDRKCWYASVNRYQHSNTSRAVLYPVYGSTPESVIDHIARRIAGVTEPLENLRKHLSK